MISILKNFRRAFIPKRAMRLFKQHNEVWNRDYSYEAPRAKNIYKQVIFIVDGSCWHGGLSDRLMCILSCYYLCKRKGIEFKLLYDFPFKLKDYLEPNMVNWNVEKEEVSYNKEDVVYFVNYANRIVGDMWVQEKLLDQIITLDYKQIHIYTNAAFSFKKDYSISFDELFKPSENLAKSVSMHLRNIAEPYVNMTFRFQQLLGDFVEQDFPTLDEVQKVELIQKCLSKIEEIKNREGYKKILVTSDSITFQKAAAELSYVYIIPGEVVHIDFTKGSDYDVYMKSFVDFYMISKAEKVYALQTGQMYKTLFPYSASLVNNIPFERVIF